VIQNEAWPFYSTIFGVRLCWELKESRGTSKFSHSCGPSKGARRRPSVGSDDEAVSYERGTPEQSSLTGVPHLTEDAPPKDHTVGLCLAP
jgi:hypothetical protein